MKNKLLKMLFVAVILAIQMTMLTEASTITDTVEINKESSGLVCKEEIHIINTGEKPICEGLKSQDQENNVEIKTKDITVDGNQNVITRGVEIKDNIGMISLNTGDISVTNRLESGSSQGDAGVWLSSKTDIMITCKNVTVNSKGDNVTGIFSKVKGSGDIKVLVEGDVDSDGIGIKSINTGGSGNATIVVEGIVCGDKKALEIPDPSKTDITVWGLESSDPKNLADSDAVLESVNYIIKGNNGTDDYANMTLPTNLSTVKIGDKEYYTAKEDTVITVTVNDGYNLKSTVTPDSVSGNVYTITIPRGGMVTVEAIMKAIQQAQSSGGGSAWTSVPMAMGSQSAPIADGSWGQAVNGKWQYKVNGELVRNATAWITYKTADGETVTGKFYFDTSGAMATGKQTIDGEEYYFDEKTGVMLTNWTAPDGTYYGADGKKVKAA